MADQATAELLEIHRQQKEKEEQELNNIVEQNQQELNRRIQWAKEDPGLNIQEWDNPYEKQEEEKTEE